MTTTALAEDPFEVLVGRILDGTLNATPEGCWRLQTRVWVQQAGTVADRSHDDLGTPVKK